jgi:hypothetical protein
MELQNGGISYNHHQICGSQAESPASFLILGLKPIKIEMEQTFVQELSRKTPKNSRRTADNGEEQGSEDSSFSTMSELTSSTGTDTLGSGDKESVKGMQRSQSHRGSWKQFPGSRKSDHRSSLNGGTKVRRLQANARERKRMHGLKEAFDHLREHLPAWANDRKMSKYDTLLMAQTYIVRLQTILSGQVDNTQSH